jgi:hypothetical protein
MAWLMLAEGAEERSSVSTSGSIGCCQPMSGASFFRECAGKTGEGSSAACRQRRDTIGPLRCSMGGGVSESSDVFVVPRIDEESGEEVNEELSDCE